MSLLTVLVSMKKYIFVRNPRARYFLRLGGERLRPFCDNPTEAGNDTAAAGPF